MTAQAELARYYANLGTPPPVTVANNPQDRFAR